MCLSLLCCVLCKNRAMKTVTLLKYCRSLELLGIAAVTPLFPPLGSMVVNFCHTAPGVEQWGEMRVVSTQQDPAAWQWNLTVRGYGETAKDGGELGSQHCHVY